MNEVEIIQTLAAQAIRSRPPRVDPVTGVLHEIGRRRQLRLQIGLFSVLTAATAAAAVVLAVLTFHAWENLSDPLNDMLVMVSLVAS